MSALHATMLVVKAAADAQISPTQGHHAHALLLKIFQQAHPHLAEKLHNAAPYKPYTVSSLLGVPQSRGKSVPVKQGQDYFIRFTFLDGDIYPFFMDSVFKAQAQPVHLEQAVFTIQKALSTPVDSPLCGFHNYQELAESAPAADKVTLQFGSPTVFRSQGKRNVLYPEPRLVFGGLMERWQHFSPVRYEGVELTKVIERMRIARYRLSTRILHFDSYQETGFTGTCSYELGSLNVDEKRMLCALADFAFYAGAGAKTTMGMGQTRRTL